MKKNILFLMFILLSPMMASAYDACVDGIYYNLILKGKIAKVTSGGTKYRGKVVIPATVSYNGVICNVTAIEGKAFYECTGLTEVTIPNSVTLIGSYAFSSCSSLKSVTIPNSLTSIGENAFSDCTSLTSLTLPDSLTSIGNNVFWNCSALTSVTIPHGVISIGYNAFTYCSGLKSVTIPNSVTSIGNWAFQYCQNLTSITLPNYLATIEEGTFYGCSALASVIIPNGVTSIGSYAFYSCSALISVIIPDSVKSIENRAFQYCNSLTSVTFPSGITLIGNEAFANCRELTDVYCYAEKVPSTYTAFDDSYIEYATLYVPEASISSYKTTAPWFGFGTIDKISGETPEIPKCATPTVGFINGQLIFNCETEGVEFVSEIKCSDVKKNYSASVPLTTTYIVTVYATKSGYEDSDVATIEFNVGGVAGLKGDVNEDGSVNGTDIQEVINIIVDAE